MSKRSPRARTWNTISTWHTLFNSPVNLMAVMNTGLRKFPVDRMYVGWV